MQDLDWDFVELILRLFRILAGFGWSEVIPKDNSKQEQSEAKGVSPTKILQHSSKSLTVKVCKWGWELKLGENEKFPGVFRVNSIGVQQALGLVFIDDLDYTM